MSKPKEELESTNYIKDVHFLYKALISLKDSQSQKLFLKDILTPSELRMIKKRWHIAHLLLQGDNDIRTIANITKSSTQTVSKIKNILENGNGGLAKAIREMYAEMEKENKEFLKSKKTHGGSLFVKGWFK